MVYKKEDLIAFRNEATIEQKKDISEIKTKRFGVIETSIFKYWTPLMLIVAIIIIAIVGFNLNTLGAYFQTNVSLNGLIIFLMLYGLVSAFFNNFIIYRTAGFLKSLENIVKQDYVEDKDIDALHALMVKKAYLIDTQNTHNAIENLRIFGHLNFSDNDARLIKHKLGYRVRLKKSNVGFLAGILVMLGLLGTFLGLLTTIDAVGAVMGNMSGMGGGEGGAVDEAQMSGFISSLSAPLQGMGLAFSSSLFGLSGSLLIGFFNHLCGGAQDKFIENVGRWIDDQIPTYNPANDTKQENNIPAKSEDLKKWLTGFVYLSVKTNKQISALTYSLVETIKSLVKENDILVEIEKNQKSIVVQTQATNETFKIIAKSIDKQSIDIVDLLSKNVNMIDGFRKDTNIHLNSISNASNSLSKNINAIHSSQNDTNVCLNSICDAVVPISSILEVSNKISDNTTSIDTGLSEIKKYFSEFNSVNHINWEELSVNISSGLDGIKEVIKIQGSNIEIGNELNEKLGKTLIIINNEINQSNQKQEKILNTVLDNKTENVDISKIETKLEKIIQEMNLVMGQMETINEDKLKEFLNLDTDEEFSNIN